MGGETRFAYFPAATVSDGTATAVSVQAATDTTLAPAGGQFTCIYSTTKLIRISVLDLYSSLEQLSLPS